MRAMFPRDAARRAFLKSVGASTALAALSQFFPLQTATEAFAEAGTPEKKDLKVGFIPITCATPIIMAAPLGFYEKQGLNVEVVKTAGWAVIRDKTINKEYDAAHMLAPMPIAISLGLGAQRDPVHGAGDREHQRPGHHPGHQAQGQARPEGLEGHEFAVPFDYSMHNYLLRYYLAEHGIDPDNDVQLRARCRRPRWWPTCAPSNIDGFLAPHPYQPARRLSTASASSTCCPRNLRRPSLLQLPAARNHHNITNSFAALTRAIINATAYASKARTANKIAEAIAPANYINAAGHRAGAGSSRHLSETTGGVEPTPSGSTSIRSPGNGSQSGCSPR